MTKCDKCGSTAITYYKQLRKDGVWVVTARCENDHHPVTGKPFYPLYLFNLAALPPLPGTNAPEIQSELFARPVRVQSQPQTLLDLVEQKRRGSSLFPPIKR